MPASDTLKGRDKPVSVHTPAKTRLGCEQKPNLASALITRFPSPIGGCREGKIRPE